MNPNDGSTTFEKLEMSHRDKVTSYVKGISKGGLDYQDVYQQSLIKAWKNFDKFKGESAFSTWLCRICHNVAIDEYRKNSRRKTVSYNELLSEGLIKEPLSNSTPFTELKNKETGKSISSALNKIKPQYKEILVMRLNKHMTYKDISNKLNLPRGTVMSRIHLAKKNIRKHLK